MFRLRCNTKFILTVGKGGDRPAGDRGGVLGAVRASRLAKKSENETPEVFLHAAFDFDAPMPRNTAQKLKNNQKPDL